MSNCSQIFSDKALLQRVQEMGQSMSELPQSSKAGAGGGSANQETTKIIQSPTTETGFDLSPPSLRVMINFQVSGKKGRRYQAATKNAGDNAAAKADRGSIGPRHEYEGNSEPPSDERQKIARTSFAPEQNN